MITFCLHRFILVFGCLVLSVLSTIPFYQEFSSHCLLILVGLPQTLSAHAAGVYVLTDGVHGAGGWRRGHIHQTEHLFVAECSIRNADAVDSLNQLKL